MVVEFRLKVGKFVIFGFAEDVQEIVIFGGDLGVKVVEYVRRQGVRGLLCAKSGIGI